MKQVLLVHDHQEDPAIRKDWLEDVGFEVVTCGNGDAALEQIDKSKPDVVVMDVLIQGRNGFDVCRDIRKRFAVAELPVILCTGFYRKALFREEAWNAGAQGYLIRPFGPDVLVQHIHAVLSARAGEPARA